MASSPTRDVVKIDVQFATNVKKVVNEITKFSNSISENMKDNQKAAEKLGKGVGNVWKMLKNSRQASKSLKETKDQLKQIQKGIDLIHKRKARYNEMMADAEAVKDSDPDKHAKLKKTAEDYGESRKVNEKQYDATVKSMQEVQKHVKRTAAEMREALDIDWEAAGESLSTPLHDFLSRDAPTIAKRIGKMLSAPESLDKWADKRMKRGHKRLALAKATGGGKGLMKSGGMDVALGGFVKGLAAIGPIITAATGFFAGFAKILLDAEAAAKEYNKQLLETTSTASFLARNFGNASKASADLQNSLDSARDAAFDLSVAQMGISKDAARSFQAAITAEGVQLDRLGKATAGAKVSTEEHTKSIIMGVAYSRQFGVSLSEIASMQGQLMADMGMSAQSVQASFQGISEAATDAGMEANKFFGIIRGFSSDLSLFTLRIEDLTKITRVLSKTMDPRQISQFVQSLNQKFNGGTVDSLKFYMMAEDTGGKETMAADLQDKFDNLTNTMKDAMGPGSEDKIAELMDIVRSNDPRKLTEWEVQQEKKMGSKFNSDVTGALSRLMNQNQKLSSGDRVDAASVMKDLGIMRKKEMLEAASMKMFNGKKLDQLAGIELAAVEQQGIASAEEIQMYKQLEQGLMKSQAEIVERMRSGSLTEEDKKILDHLNVSQSDRIGDAAADALATQMKEDGSTTKLWNAMNQDQQDLLKNSANVKDFQQVSAGLQTSMLDQLGMITDILQNYIFKGIELITTILRGMWGHGRDKLAERDKAFEIVRQKGGDSTLRKSWEEGMARQKDGSTGSIKRAKTNAIEDNYKAAWEGIQNAAKKSDEIKSKLGSEKDPGKRGELQKQLDELKPLQEMSKKYGNIADFHKDMYDLAESEARGGIPAMMQALQDALHAAAGGNPGSATATGAAAAKSEAPKSSQPPTQSATTSSQSPNSSVGPTASQAPAKAASAAQESADQQRATVAGVAQLQRTVANDGVKLHPATLAGPLKDAMAQSVYEGAAKALFEYYLYSGIDRSQVVNSMMNGMDPKAITGSVMAGAANGMMPAASLAGAVIKPPNAMGGTVSGIMDGMANIVRPAPGEGWASVGAGETIVPAGGGGGGGGGAKITLELKGDLKRFVDARVVEGAAAHDRNKRHR